MLPPSVRREAELERAVVEGGLTKDPLRLPLGALAVTLGAMEKLFTATAARFQTDIGRSRSPAGGRASAGEPASRSKIHGSTPHCGGAGASQEVLSLVRTHNLRMSLLAGVVFAGSVLTVGMACFWWGRWSAGANFAKRNRRWPRPSGMGRTRRRHGLI